MDLSAIFLALAFVADVLAGQTGTQAQLQQKAAAEIPLVLAAIDEELKEKHLSGFIDLRLAWGPVVYQAPRSDVADNLMYVAQNEKAPNDYTVGIAGTNFKSLFDWLVEDGFVSTTVPWHRGGSCSSASDPCIALGTSIGLSILEGMSSVPTVPAGSTHSMKLMDYLRQQMGDASGTVYVTGHSLGGALAPVVALWLQENKSYWGPNASVKVYAFAGPTPGNKAFAHYYDGKLGSATTRVWNKLDAVPHAWGHRTPPDLSQIAGLYEDLPAAGRVEPGPLIDGFVDLLEYISRRTDYAHLNNDGGFSVSKYADVTKCDSNLGKFLVQAVYQHTVAYKVYYKFPAGPPLLTCETVDGVVEALEKKIRQELPD